MISCHARDCQRKLTGTWVPGYPGTQGPGDQILGKYEVLLVPVTGISKPGNSREYPGNWQKGNNENAIFILKRISWRISYEMLPKGA